MSITSVSIHPAIGIARVGDSPDGFFIGPEKPREKPDPDGGFKDAECRVKRQGARFRVFATHDDGTVEELTDDDADIEWSVHLANRKAATRSQPGSSSDLTIDPGKRSLDGPNERTPLDSGTITFPPDPDPAYPSAGSATVPLGEIRTDTDGRLIVLGGHGNSGSPTGKPIQGTFDNERWYDDTSDGPVTATVTMEDSGDTFTAEGAWVLVTPPKFSPGLDNVITLYDRLFHLMATENYVTPPSTPSYTEDIYPILERANQSQWVTYADAGDHSGSLGTGGSWSQPVYDPTARQRIFSKLKAPGGGGGNMPPLHASTDIGRLTATQYELMRKWKDDDFQRDWSGPPSPPADVTPDGMDEAALENGVGAAFYPGIEVGGFSGTRVILEPSNYTDAFRLDHGALGPGDLTKHMAVPWQTDFHACGTNWWPVPRPNQVHPQDGSGPKQWDRRVSSGSDMVSKWSDLGFVVEQEDQYVEVDRCGIPFITLLTPTVDFGSVPEGPMGASRTAAYAIEFEISAPSSSVALSVQSGPSHPHLTAVTSSRSAGPTSGSGVETVRFWVRYRTQSPGDSLTDTVTIAAPATGETWTVDLSAETVGRKTAATSLVLDRSGSMSEDRGDGKSKHESLEEAASIFVDVMLEDDGVGIVRYNQDAQELLGVTTLGPAGTSDPARTRAKNAITGSGLRPRGQTSIGDGIHRGRSTLNATSGFDVESLVVLTDGKENEPRSIADVAGSIDERTYSVGLGQPSNTSAPALQTISGNSGGYLLVTGDVDADDEFILKKYFLQILSGVSNAEVVLDPDGTLTPGAEHRIPFHLTDVDTGLDVILLTDEPSEVDFRLETPYGNVIEPWRANADPTMRWVLSEGVAYYRLSLPVELMDERFERRGRWHARLTLGDPQLEPESEEEEEDFADRREREDEREGEDDAGDRGHPDVPDVARAAMDAGARPPSAPPVEERDPGLSGGAGVPAFATHPDHPGREHYRVTEAETGGDSDGLRYSLLVHTYSDLKMDARVHPTGYEPGDELHVVASLTESGIPIEEASVRAHVTRPNGTDARLRLETGDGSEYRGTIETTTPGIYRVQVRASGETQSGVPFQREHVATGAVWNGGAHDADASQSGGDVEPDRGRLACELLECLSGDALAPERLAEYGIEVDALRECLRTYCEEVDDREPEGETRPESRRPDVPVEEFDHDRIRDLLDALTETRGSDS